MGYRQFSEEFKKSAIQKVLLRGNKNIEQACAEVGISSLRSTNGGGCVLILQE